MTKHKPKDTRVSALAKFTRALKKECVFTVVFISAAETWCMYGGVAYPYLSGEFVFV